MLEDSALEWLGFGCLVALASWTGLQVSRALLWKEAVYRVRIPLAFGLALAPFLAGFAVMVPMVVLRGASHASHVAVAFGLLIVAGVLAKALARPQGKLLCLSGKGFGVYLLGGYLLLWILMLGVNAVFLPLLQNDALEYATVGRILFESRDLLSYPAIHPETTSSGFYGPWTHPPLYVALIYLSYVIQGHAHEPGLMRLIAPWFLVTAVCALIALGTLASRRIGLISGILLISTPLLFLGADSALIDALPVSGMVLLLVALVGLQAQQPRYSLTVGAVVGVVLWTHSQAILFIPLMAAVLIFQNGLLRWRSALSSVALATGAALLVGGGYYVRNYFLFGSPISDNPAVFALEKLDWNAYFSYGRGLDHWVAKLQYGIFKGWFSFEAYGLLFWFGAAGFVLVATKWAPQTKTLIGHGICNLNIREQIYAVCFVLFVIYMAGVVASVLLGSDLMIRNERYQLVSSPLAAVAGGAFLDSLLYYSKSKISAPSSGTLVRNLCLLPIVFLFLYFAALFTIPLTLYRHAHAFLDQDPGSGLPDQNESTWTSLSNASPAIALQRIIAHSVRMSDTVLSLKPSDMFYGNKRMISYLDPRLLSFYDTSDADSGARLLRDLGITHIHVGDSWIPPYYNSVLTDIISNPTYTTLLAEKGPHKLFILKSQSSGTENVQAIANLSPSDTQWDQQIKISLGGRKALASVPIAPRLFGGGVSVCRFPLFSRNMSRSLIYPSSQASPVESMAPLALKPGEYIASFKLRGCGFVRIEMRKSVARSKHSVDEDAQSKATIIGECSLSRNQPFIRLTYRFRMLYKGEVGFELTQSAMSTIQYAEIRVSQIDSHLSNSETGDKLR